MRDVLGCKFSRAGTFWSRLTATRSGGSLKDGSASRKGRLSGSKTVPLVPNRRRAVSRCSRSPGEETPPFLALLLPFGQRLMPLRVVLQGFEGNRVDLPQPAHWLGAHPAGAVDQRAAGVMSSATWQLQRADRLRPRRAQQTERCDRQRVCCIHLSAEAWVARMSAETSRQHHAE